MATIVISEPLAATKTPVSTGRMSSREAARATRSMLAPSSLAGIFSPGSSPGVGSFGKSSAGRTRRWKLELPLRISTSCSASRNSISTVESASERATSASNRPGSSTDPSASTSAASVVSNPMSRSVAESVTRPVGGGDEDAGEGLGRGARRYSPGNDRKLGDEFFAFGRELQVLDAFLSWVRACGKSECRGGNRAGTGFLACGRGCGKEVILAVPSAVSPVGRRDCG